jgi:hypothetical protein
LAAVAHSGLSCAFLPPSRNTINCLTNVLGQPIVIGVIEPLEHFGNARQWESQSGSHDLDLSRKKAQDTTLPRKVIVNQSMVVVYGANVKHPSVSHKADSGRTILLSRHCPGILPSELVTPVMLAKYSYGRSEIDPRKVLAREVRMLNPIRDAVQCGPV